MFSLYGVSVRRVHVELTLGRRATRHLWTLLTLSGHHFDSSLVHELSFTFSESSCLIETLEFPFFL
jgi:hypothetical protein